MTTQMEAFAACGKRIAELEQKAAADREYMDAAEKRIAELEAEVAALRRRNDELRSTLAAYLVTIKRLQAKDADREADKAELAALRAENERLRLHQDWLRDETLVSQLDTINRQASLWKAERKRAEQAETELAAAKARYENAEVCGSCWHYDSFGSALYCTIEVPERIHAYDHERDFSCRCQYDPSRWAAQEETP